MQRRDEFGGSSSSSDASDEEDGGWLAQSQFDIRLEHSEDTAGRPSVRERRPLSEAGADVGPVRAEWWRAANILFQNAFPPPPADSPFNDPFSTEDDDVSVLESYDQMLCLISCHALCRLKGRWLWPFLRLSSCLAK
jgi:serine/threonine-protein phosphatase 6 regulatory subunit 3